MRIKAQNCATAVTPADLERQLLRQGQCACRGKAGYVPVTVLLLEKGRPVPSIADAPGLDQGTVSRYAQTYHKQDLVGSLRAEQPSYRGPAHQRPTGQLVPRTRPDAPSPGWPTLPASAIWYRA